MDGSSGSNQRNAPNRLQEPPLPLVALIALALATLWLVPPLCLFAVLMLVHRRPGRHDSLTATDPSFSTPTPALST